jgi:hypothetical protein
MLTPHKFLEGPSSLNKSTIFYIERVLPYWIRYVEIYHCSAKPEASACRRESSLSGSGFTQINLGFSAVEAAVTEHDALLRTLR